MLHRQDVRSALIERPSVSMNRDVLRGDLRSDAGSLGRRQAPALFKREAFRAWMVALNRRGGVVLLDALPPEPLDRLLRDFFARDARALIRDHGVSRLWWLGRWTTQPSSSSVLTAKTCAPR